MHERLPVVVALNRGTIPQERFNGRFIAERGLGLVVHQWDEVAAGVSRYRGDAALQQRLRASLDSLPQNRAVYEVVSLIDEELRAARRRGAGQRA